MDQPENTGKKEMVQLYSVRPEHKGQPLEGQPMKNPLRSPAVMFQGLGSISMRPKQSRYKRNCMTLF